MTQREAEIEARRAQERGIGCLVVFGALFFFGVLVMFEAVRIATEWLRGVAG